MFGTTHIFTTCLTRSMIFRHQVPAQALLLFGGLTCAYQSCFSMGCKYERDFRAGARGRNIPGLACFEVAQYLESCSAWAARYDKELGRVCSCGT